MWKIPKAFTKNLSLVEKEKLEFQYDSEANKKIANFL